MNLSLFGKKFTGPSGILHLMDDLGKAMSGRQAMRMLGGGNPAHIPEIQKLFLDRMRALTEDPAAFARMIGNYDTPQGEERFVHSLARLLKREYGWQIGPENIALTLGSQSSFFVLFNALAGRFADGSRRKILLPLTPEYIGYADQGLDKDMFVSVRPRIELLDDSVFKYHVDFDRLPDPSTLGAVCVSRPTNPTGNVLTDEEIRMLDAYARSADIPLIVDGAYGMPFPNIVFTDANPFWNENMVVCLSLSKLGLPSTRTGIVVARKEIIDLVAAANAIMALAPSSLGAGLALDLLDNGDILRISREIIQPFYEKKSRLAMTQLREELNGLPCRVHKSEGAIFLWLWCEGLQIPCGELYERLKGRGVLVVPGHYFFPGLTEDWPHRHECIRITYSQPEAMVREGLSIIAEEVRKAYDRQTSGC